VQNNIGLYLSKRAHLNPTLEAFVKYMRQQHFIAEEMPVDDLFVPIHGRIE